MHSSTTNQRNIFLLYIIKFFVGIVIGPAYVTRYIVAIGAAYHFGYSNLAIILIAMAFCFIVEFMLEVSSGYRADKYGEKLTFFFSMFARAAYFCSILAAVSLAQPSPLTFTAIVLLAYLFFGISYCLLSGNLEEFVQKQCDEENSLRVFSVLNILYALGATTGLVLVITILPSQNYAELFSTAVPVYSVSFAALIVCIVATLCLQNANIITVKRFFSFLGSYFTVNKEKQKEQKEDIQLAKKDLAAHRKLNRIFWVQAGMYGVFIAIEVLIPTYVFVSQNFSLVQKFILLIFCFLLPNALGSVFKIGKKKDTSHSLGNLSKELTLFFVLAIMFAVVSVFPFAQTGSWYQDPVFLAFGFVTISFMIVAGSIIPHFYDYCSKLVQSTSAFPKTVLSIGERRKKIGAFLSLLISAGGVIFQIKESYFWVVAFIAFIYMVYSWQVFASLNQEMKESLEAN